MSGIVELRQVWPPPAGWETCPVTHDGRHWPFPHHNGSACCAACGQVLPKACLSR